MFIRIRGSLNKGNIITINSTDFDSFKYVVFNLDNLLSIDSYAINYIISCNNKKIKDNGKLIICDSNNSLGDRLFKNRIPIINNEIQAFNIL